MIHMNSKYMTDIPTFMFELVGDIGMDYHQFYLKKNSPTPSKLYKLYY